MRARSLCVGLLAAMLATFVAVSEAHAQTTDVVVGVPIEDGKAGKPQPGVIVDLEGEKRRDPLPDPVIIHEVESPGTTTVRPKFGGGYVETEGGSKTEVKPNFGGGYDRRGRRARTASDRRIATTCGDECGCATKCGDR
jgi:hypothetical protein